ncbi:MAG TPA: lipoate--protein ligase family protein [Gemmatimonadales bacterium]|nr:lipoate--protein ligase family protein [Gemmatimonadales bacterium]
MTATRRLCLALDHEARSGAENMAVDQTLLDRADQSGAGFLRLYRWAPFCLSFGRHEPALRRYDRTRIASLGLDVVRRPTGGRAVWHARELTYSVAAPIAWFGSLSESYCEIHRLLARALERLGVPALLAPSERTPNVGSGACFASPVGGEVLVHGRKLVGSAQVRQGSAFLQHGSILLADDQEMVARVTRGEAPASDEITLSEALGREVTFSEAADAVTATLGDDLDLSEAPIAPAADPEHLARFRDPAWTWRR